MVKGLLQHRCIELFKNDKNKTHQMRETTYRSCFIFYDGMQTKTEEESYEQ